jgi:hypothetical protein
LVSEAQREFTYDDILVAGTGKSVGVKPADAEQERSGQSSEQTSRTLVAQASSSKSPERLQKNRAIIDDAIGKAKQRGAYTADMEERMETEFRKLNTDSENDTTIPRMKAILRIINNRGISKYDESKLFPANGKIDQKAPQGREGDCFLLAPIISFAASDKGRKILENIISVDANNNVTVTLKGQKFKITEAELKGSDHLSRGDLDIRAIEIAVERYVLEHGLKDGSKMQYDISAGRVDDAMELLTGNQIFYTDNTDKKRRMVREFDINKQAMSFNTTDDKSVKLLDENGKEYSLLANHAYAVVGKDADYVYLIDPHRPDRKLRMSTSDFLQTDFFAIKCDL